MKIFITTLVLAVFFVFASCKSDSSEKIENDTNSEVVDTNTTNPQDVILGKEYTSHYICPNHCQESGSDEPGVCPVCGMEYIENFDYQK